MNIYTDGSCLGNPGPGGWAALSDKANGVGPILKVCGGDLYTTNNQMELREEYKKMAPKSSNK